MFQTATFEKDIAEVIQQTKQTVVSLRSILEADKDLNLLYTPKFNEVIDLILERLDNYSKSIVRNYFKCVFLGRTSSGKSSSINALMKKPLLPVGLGHTTNCFIALKTTPNSEIYVQHISDNSTVPNAVYGIEDIKRLTNAVSKDKLNVKDHIVIHVPSNLLPVISSNVQVLDTPGLDIDGDFDEIIENYCLDADVFVLVCNAETVLMQCERKFLKKVRDKFTRPLVMIVNNRWDISANITESEAKEVKEQQMKLFSHFLTEELKICTASEVHSKVFFVSMLEENKIVSECDETLINVEGRAERAKDYARFYTEMHSLLSNDAMKNKMKSQLTSFENIIEQINMLFNSVIDVINAEREILTMNLSPQSKYLMTLEKEIGKVHEQSLSTIEKVVLKVKNNIIVDFEKIVCGFDSDMGVSKLKFNPYDKKAYMDYQKIVVDRMEVQVNDGLEKFTIAQINDNLENHFEKLTKAYKDLLLKHKPNQARTNTKFPVIKAINSPNSLVSVKSLNEKLQEFSKSIKKVPRYFEDRQSCIRTLKSLEHRFTKPPKSTRISTELRTCYSKDDKLESPKVILILPKFNTVMMNDFAYTPGFKFTLSPSYLRECSNRWHQTTNCSILKKLTIIPYSVMVMVGCSVLVFYNSPREKKGIGLSSLLTLYFLLYGFESLNWNDEKEMESLKHQFLMHSKTKMDNIVIISASTTAKQLGSYLYMDLRGLHQGCEMLIQEFRTHIENLQSTDHKLQTIERQLTHIVSNDLYFVKQQIGVLKASTDTI